MAEAETRDIFISHASEDRLSIAEPLCRYLEDAGLRCWIAPRDIPLGEPFTSRLTQGVENSQCVLVIHSQMANKPDCWIVDEVLAARDRKKRIVVIRTDDAKLSDALSIIAAQRQGLDVRGQPVEAWAQPLIDRLKDALGLVSEEQPQSSGHHPMTTLLFATAMTVNPLWRARPRDTDEFEFELRAGETFADGSTTYRLRFPASQKEVMIGRDTLPHATVSRRALRLERDGGLLFASLHPNCSSQVMVGRQKLSEGLRVLVTHGMPIYIGKVQGQFVDHRYLPTQLPAGALDEETGLLSEAGLAVEASFAARRPGSLLLALAPRAPGTPLAALKTLALDLHHLLPDWPVARTDSCVLTIGVPSPLLESKLEALRGSFAQPLIVGSLPIGPAPSAAAALIAETRGALESARAAADPAPICDLRQHRIPLHTLGGFLDELERQKPPNIGLLAIEDFAQLEQFGPDIVRAEEKRLLGMLSQRLGQSAIFTQPCVGVIAFASPASAETTAQALLAEWQGKRVSNGILEVELKFAAETLSLEEAPFLADHALRLAEAVRHGTSLEGLPVVFAHFGQRALQASSRSAKASALHALASGAVHFMQIVTSAVAATLPPAAREKFRAETHSWDSLAASAARFLLAPSAREAADGGWLRFRELVRGLYQPSGQVRDTIRAPLADLERLALLLGAQPDMVPISEEEHGTLEAAVRRLSVALKGLHGWTLLGVERVDMLPYVEQAPVFRVQYIDYTGPHANGRRDQCNMLGLPLSCSVHLARLSEGVSVSLEPFLRRRFNAGTQTQGLFAALQPITAPGNFVFRALDGAAESLAVEERSIPQAFRRSAGQY